MPMESFIMSATGDAAYVEDKCLLIDTSMPLHGIALPDLRFGVAFFLSWDSAFSSKILQLRKKLDRALNILKVLSNTSWGASRLSLLRVYRAAILSKIDYGCTIYGSARQSVLQKLNTIHQSALRLCSGAFRTSPVESLYVECHEPSLEHRRQMLTLHYFSKILTNPNHPYFNYKQSRFLQRLQDARPSVVPSFFTRAAGFLYDFNLDTAQLLPNPVILLTPWIPHELKFLNPFENYDKTNTASDIYLQLFTHNRELYHHFIPVFTNGSKTTTQTSFACVFINSTLSFQIHPSCSIFTAEIRAILHSLSEISNYPADNCIIYSDSLSVLQALSSLHRHSHPLAFSILDLHDRLVCKGFSILLSWVPSHVGISGNEIADIAAKNASGVLDNSTPLKDFKHYINLALHSRWENHWNSQSMNKLRSIKPVVESWSTLNNRKADTIVTRLRVGHTRYTHRHLLMGEQAPMCTQCNCTMSVLHILSECPNFNSLRLRYFQTSSISLTNLLGKTPHVHLLPFLKSIGFYPLI
ncbi:hypothetical protein AVEN_2122-1 [Araneus ventricosus]|uniref:RNase H type-1 domain-containing protein n=1 Tax=Araneus ventricosus TaxID=182803 RepID=A0A4Y2E9E3_ARAVE|nr:hypothetical protein AVEN_2122-1 [Araneus ventricosus]